MSFAPNYTPTTSFANDETNTVSGRSTMRTVAIDAELANISASITALKSNAQAIQRDDDKLKDFIVEPYALSEQTRSLVALGGMPRGQWTALAAYAVKDVVQHLGFAFLCYTQHTAGNTFLQAGLWIAISGDGSSAASAAAAAASSVSATSASSAAASSALAAGNSATSSMESATAAGSSATTAGTSASSAGTSASNSANSADAAGVSATAAQTSGSAIALRADLATPPGAALSGYIGIGAGAVATTVQAVLRETISIARFGVTPGNTDNTAAMAAVVAYLATFVSTGILPRITIPSGVYSYTTSPNWALQGLCLETQGVVVFKCTGAGIAFNLDGGATGPGVRDVRIQNKLKVTGNALTTTAVFARAVHHSKINVEPRDCTVGLETAWCVCTEFWFRCSPVGYPAFAKVPTTGILLGKRAAGETTSACVFYNPIAEGIAAYGINLADAVQNTFIGGTSESNDSGLFVSATSANNCFAGLDLEFNTSVDINCVGAYNVFDNILSSTTSTIAGTSNQVRGGLFDIILAQGVDNEFIKPRYASNLGAFTDTGTGTVKRSVRNLTSGSLDPELVLNPHKLLFIDGPVGNNTVMGSNDQIDGGPASDFSIYHYGTGEVAICGQGVKKIRAAGVGVGFNGAAPLAKPVISGSRGGNAALGSLLTALAVYGLITNSTTA